MALLVALQGLRQRQCIADMTANIGPQLSALRDVSNRIGVYAGFDPTGPSLHLGHASVIMMLQRLQRLDMKPYALIGGATALIGDPSGKKEDRPLLSRDAVESNIAGIRACLSKAIDFNDSSAYGAVVVNNADFYSGVSVLDFLRDTGRHFRVSSMLAKDSVKSRLTGETHGAGGPSTGTGHHAPGISFTEFAYQIFQASDFARLHALHGVQLQVGGSDQWGNITAGVDLVHKTTGAAVHGLTVPLLTSPSGKKFGKTEGNAIWLDPALTSDHAFWQYLLRREDGEVGTLLGQLTHMAEEEVEDLLARHAQAPEKKLAQMALADAVTLAFRGSDAVRVGHRCAQILYAGTAMWPSAQGSSNSTASTGQHLPQRALLPSMQASDLLSLSSAGDLPSCSLGPSAALGTSSSAASHSSSELAIQGQGMSVMDVVVKAGLAKSKGEARRLLESGGIYWNWERVSASDGSWRVPPSSDSSTDATTQGKAREIRPVTVQDFIQGKVAVVSAGRKRMALVQLA